MLPSSSRLWRAVLGLLAVAALLSACGGDDGDSSSDDNDNASEASSPDDDSNDAGDGSPVEGACSILDPADLTNVTGVEFDRILPGPNSCTYSSTTGAAAIALNVADLEGADPEDALEAARRTCDENTIVQLDFSDSAGGYGCLVNGVSTVATVGDGLFAVLTGSTRDTSTGTDRILQDLATILEDAITRA